MYTHIYKYVNFEIFRETNDQPNRSRVFKRISHESNCMSRLINTNDIK